MNKFDALQCATSYKKNYVIEINKQMYSNVASFKKTRKLKVEITKINALLNILLLYILMVDDIPRKSINMTYFI